MRAFGCLLLSLVTLHVNSSACLLTSIFSCAFNSVFASCYGFVFVSRVLLHFMFFVLLCPYVTVLCPFVFVIRHCVCCYHLRYLLTCQHVFIISNYFDLTFVNFYTYYDMISCVACAFVTTSVRMLF